MPPRAHIARKLVSVCHRLAEQGLVTATDGNVSARLGRGRFLVTPTGLNKGKLTARDLVEVNAAGQRVVGRRTASTEIGMHLFIYRERPDVQAVVHAHPTYATGFAVAHLSLTAPLLPEVVIGLGEIPVAPYGTPSTPELAETLLPFVKTANAVLLGNHGAVTFGGNLEEAYSRMEKVEQAACIAFVARLLGGEKPLAAQDVEKLRGLTGKGSGETPTEPFSRT